MTTSDAETDLSGAPTDPSSGDTDSPTGTENDTPSAEPDGVTVPDVRTLQLDAAEAELNQAGFYNVTFWSVDYMDYYGQGRDTCEIVEQEPIDMVADTSAEISLGVYGNGTGADDRGVC
ncbi:PASTA domain-containing protein [Glycomyces sp. MUSA5-2]|uniref:PASTA domain-containing protein n=1 Tax=Glycomyces sp. MUSA5-2 TaxID=2053002 RepID=UPI0030081B8C